MMASIHLIERLDNLSEVDTERGEWESGYWVVSKENATKLIGENIYFHEYQNDPSFFGGQILGFYIRPESNKVVFRFKALDSYSGVVTSHEGWRNEQKRDWD